MKRIPHPHAQIRTASRGLAARALVLLTLLAFTLQGFLTQTHIHALPVGAPAVADYFDGVPAPSKDTPSKNDQQTCPLCHQVANAGQFITPAAAAVALPSLSVSVIQSAVRIVHAVTQVSHDWRGRAPPHA
ncbi:MAG TPA: hypothetical protein VGC36_13885 [Rhizomicrobium sp.]